MSKPANHLPPRASFERGGAKRVMVDRRSVLAGMASLAALPAGRAMAEAREIVLVNWGGDAIGYFGEAFAEPYEAEHGVDIVIDGSGPSQGKIRNMVESGAVTWDVCDSGGGSSIQLGSGGYLREVDYSVVDRDRLLPGMDFRWGVANYMYSFVLAYDTRAFGGDGAPRAWADFFNVRDFPGTRALLKDVLANLEVALMGAGIPRDEVYPITPAKEKLAWETIRAILPDTVFAGTGAEIQQLMRNRDIVMGCFWNTRVKAIHEETGGLWDWTWNQGVVVPGAWVVPKGNPAGDAVWPFIASMQSPERQVRLFTLFGNAPANPQAAALVPPALKRFNATDPENYARQLPIDSAWYGENYARINKDYIDTISM
ncbi:extracellular solute-binding protein [Acuticoccus sediminis]|uniref:extracellular solute-binding protein n=1 Tax=Acuticoccus sediminis TaxID=2184697 RepID=UPI001CFD8757|nr:extracellular solute-binding protein [Acuticoccus sediminis]